MPNNDPFTRPTPVTAAALVEWFERSLEESQEWQLRRFGALEYAKALADGHGDKGGVLRLPNQRIATSIQVSAGDWAIARNWRKTKIVYDVDPTLCHSLADMDTTDVLPGGILRQLPHPNPLFVFPGGFPLDLMAREPGILRAMYVSGRRADNTFCSTHDPEVSNYQLTFKTDLLNDGGQVMDLDSARISVDLVDGAFTITGLIDKVIDGYAWDPLLANNSTQDAKRKYLEALAHFGIAHLLYVCSDKADTHRRPVGRKPPKKGQRPEKPLQTYQLGWRIGPAIKATRELIERERQGARSSGRTVAPHVRKAHLHSFRHGKGRELVKVQWLPPIFVNAEGNQVNLDGTIVPVTK